MLCESETLDRGYAVVCIFRTCYNVLVDMAQMRGDDRGLDPFSVDVDSEPDSIRRIAECEMVGPIQSDVELSARNGLNECGCAQGVILGGVFDERNAVHADRDSSPGEAVGVHLGRCGDVALVVLVVEWWAKVRLRSRAKQKAKRELLNSTRKEQPLVVTCNFPLVTSRAETTVHL
jgi:hypothetical protein